MWDSNVTSYGFKDVVIDIVLDLFFFWHYFGFNLVGGDCWTVVWVLSFGFWFDMYVFLPNNKEKDKERARKAKTKTKTKTKKINKLKLIL